jgi:hypothetical protein
VTTESPATIVCVLGMHRSGTSLVSRLLNLLGVHLGPPELVANSAPDNPKGHWENISFVYINEDILARFGGTWDHPPEFPPSWAHDPCLDDLRAKARDFLTRDFAAQPLWGWKDPRTCLTLPFWQDVVGPMRYVICLRNPGAVAASLAARDGMSAEQAERLWDVHAGAALANTAGQPRMFVCYEDLIHDWPTELRRMAAFVGESPRAGDRAVLEAAVVYLEPALCHHRVSLESLLADDRISIATKRTYVALQERALAARRDDLADSA